MLRTDASWLRERRVGSAPGSEPAVCLWAQDGEGDVEHNEAEIGHLYQRGRICKLHTCSREKKIKASGKEGQDKGCSRSAQQRVHHKPAHLDRKPEQRWL